MKIDEVIEHEDKLVLFVPPKRGYAKKYRDALISGREADEKVSAYRGAPIPVRIWYPRSIVEGFAVVKPNSVLPPELWTNDCGDGPNTRPMLRVPWKYLAPLPEEAQKKGI